MAGLRQTQSVETKHKLSNTLRNWLPILHSSLSDLGEAMAPFVESNPVVEVESGYEEDFEKKIPRKVISGAVSNSRTEQIEALTIQKRTLHDVLDEQLEAPLFPTPMSQNIAQFVISNFDENGYYEGETEEFCQKNDISVEAFEKVRLRFAHIDPIGIGAKNLSESFLFQLDGSEISDAAYPLALELINNLQEMHSFSNREYFSDVMKTISTFRNPPAPKTAYFSSLLILDK